MATTSRNEAFTHYLAARQPALLRTAYLLTGDPHQAEDVLQTALAKLYLAWDRVDPATVDQYLRRIMVNEQRSLWRRPWKRRETPTEEFFRPPAQEDHYDEGLGAEVWSLVSALPRRARAVVVLRYYEQLSEREVAELLGISVGTVKSQSSRALATLRQTAPEHLNAYRVPVQDEAPISTAAVRGEASKIRTRRRASVAGAAALLAALVPLGMWALDSNSERSAPPIAVTPDERPAGLSVLHDGVVTRPDGSTVDVGMSHPNGDGYGVLTDGQVLLTHDSSLVRYDTAGVEVAREPLKLSTLGVDAAQRAAAWVSTKSEIRLLRSGQKDPVTIAAAPNVDWQVDQVTCAADCTVVLSNGTEIATATAEGGFQPLQVAQQFTVRDISPDGTTWAVDLAPTDGGQYGCAALWDVASEQVTQTNCDTSNLTFAPDGKHLVGHRGDNSMARQVSVLDAKLQEIATPSNSEEMAFSTWSIGWRDDNTLLLGAVDWTQNPAEWTLHSYTVADGNEELIEGPIDGVNPESGSEWYFPK